MITIKNNPPSVTLWGPIQYYFDFSIVLGRLQISPKMRNKKQAMGRFGGGWNWKFGFQAGGSTLIIDLLVMSIRIEWEKKK